MLHIPNCQFAVRLLLILITYWAVLAWSVAIAPAATPRWIWSQRGQSEFQCTASFTCSADIPNMKLRVAADFCRATVSVNGKPVCRLNQLSHYQAIDVNSRLNAGRNMLNVVAHSNGGPAAIAFQLVGVAENGPERVYVASGSNHGSGSNDTIRPGWQSFGDVASETWWNVKRSPTVSVFDEYNQWKEAKVQASASNPVTFELADGFQIEAIVSAGPDHGSWVSMEVDREGRVLLGREDRGILRLTLPTDQETEPTLETINDTLRGVQGLLQTDQGLIVSANRSQGLYRMTRDDQGDPFGDITLLQKTEGNQGDHGRHDVVRDDRGRLYLVHGDAVPIPDRFRSFVPITGEFDQGPGLAKPEDGHVIQTDSTGKRWIVFCSGLRNPYGLAVNRDGELFTYDADAERHTGLPWYRPTRITHLMPGVDYGWRNPGRPLPGYLPDMVPPIVAIGRGSPTALQFAYDSGFPPRYRNALMALDWSFGRLLAIHVVPQGSTYTGHAEVLINGRPFSVCDLDFAPDGSMLLVTGGRKTQSTLYRVSYVDAPPPAKERSRQQVDRNAYSKKLRAVRRKLERLYRRHVVQANEVQHKRFHHVDLAWNYLPHPDLGIRSAARILLEHHPTQLWSERLWNEQRPEYALPALLAYTRTGPPAKWRQVHQVVSSLPLSTPYAVQIAVRIHQLIDQQADDDAGRSRSIRQQLASHYPSGHREVDRELCQLLAHHDSSEVVPRTLELLSSVTDQIDQFHYLSCLADAEAGWNAKRRDAYLRLLNGARLYLTDEGLDEYLNELFEAALQRVPEGQRSKYKRFITLGQEKSDRPKTSLPFVREWTVDSILQGLANPELTRSATRGARFFRLAQCARCHRHGQVGRAFGPDLTTVAERFSQRYILEQLVQPSKTIASQWQAYTITLKNGQVVTGQVVYNGFRKSILKVATDPMALHETIEIDKDDVQSYRPSPTSPMPAGLLNTLTIQQIADLLAFLKS